MQRHFLAKNLIASWLTKAVAFVASVAITGIGARHLSLELLGLWAIVSSVALYLQYFDLGIATALHRSLPKLIKKQKWDEIREAVWAAVVLLAVLGIAIAAFAGVIADALVRSYEIPAGYSESARAVVFLAIAITALGFPFRIGLGLLGSVHQFYVFNAMEAVGALAKVACIVLLASFLRLTFESYAIALLVAPLLVLVGQTISGFKALSFYRLQPVLPTGRAIASLGNISTASLMVSLSNLLLSQGSVLVVGYYLGAIGAAMYAYPSLLVMSLIGFTGALATMFTPIASEASAENDHSRLRDLFLKGSEFVSVLGCLALVFLVLSGRDVLEIWLAAKEDAASLTEMTRILAVAAVGGVASSVGFLARNTLVGLGRYWRVAAIEVTVTAAGFAVALMLVSQPDRPLLLFAVAIAGTMMVKAALVLPVAACQALKLSFGTFAWVVLARPVMTAVAAFWCGSRVLAAFEDLDWRASLTAFAVAGLVWITVFLLFGGKIPIKAVRAQLGRGRSATRAR